MANRIQLRRDTSANWATINPILADGEPGLEIDTNKIKYGDGTHGWVSLSYSGSSDPTRLVNGSSSLTLNPNGDVTLAGGLNWPHMSLTYTDNIADSALIITDGQGGTYTFEKLAFNLGDNIELGFGSNAVVTADTGGNVSINANGENSIFGIDGTLTLPGNIKIGNLDGSVCVQSSRYYLYDLLGTSGGSDTVIAYANLDSKVSVGDNITDSHGNTYQVTGITGTNPNWTISTNWASLTPLLASPYSFSKPNNNGGLWQFGANGSLTAPGPIYGGSNTIGLATPAPLNLNNTGPVGQVKTQLNLINTAGNTGTGSAIDYFTYVDQGNGLPGARLSAVDDGNYSANFNIALKGRGNAGNNGLTTVWQFGSTGVFYLPNNSYIQPNGTSVNWGVQGNFNLLTDDANNSTTKTFTFGADGTITFPSNTLHTNNNLTVQTSGIPASVTGVNYSSGSWDVNQGTNISTTGGTGAGLTVDVTADVSGYVGSVTIHTPGNGYSDGDVISASNGGSSVQFSIHILSAKSWTFGADGTLTFPDSTVQTSAYYPIRSGFNASAPIVQIDNAQFSFNNTGNPTVAAVSGTWEGPWTADAKIWDGTSSYVTTSYGNTAATWTSIAAYGIGVTFGNAGDQVIAHFTDNSTGHLYRVSWFASASAVTTNCTIIVEKLI